MAAEEASNIPRNQHRTRRTDAATQDRRMKREGVGTWDPLRT
jgi:hypothetical protein